MLMHNLPVTAFLLAHERPMLLTQKMQNPGICCSNAWFLANGSFSKNRQNALYPISLRNFPGQDLLTTFVTLILTFVNI